jgi:phage tail-like protein
MPAKQPRPASHFTLQLDGREAVGSFRECQGLDSETSVIEHTSVDDGGLPTIRKVPGQNKWSNIVLKRGVDEQTTLWQWRQEVLDAGPDQARTDGIITLVDYDKAVIAAWSFRQGFPIKYTGATLNAGGNEVAVEEIHICHEWLTRTQ